MVSPRAFTYMYIRTQLYRHGIFIPMQPLKDKYVKIYVFIVFEIIYK